MKRQSILLFRWLLLATPVAAPAQFSYTVTNGTLTITGYIGTDANVVIPSTLHGLPVTSIRTSAFLGSGLTSIVIPNSVSSIGDSAFDGCNSLTNVTIPNSVTNIGGSAFLGYSLTAITVDSANQNYISFGGVLFDKAETTLIQYPEAKAGTSYTIPDTVTSLGQAAFLGCYELTSVTIPNSFTSIGGNAFESCPSLTNVTIPNSVTSIRTFSFLDCVSLSNVTIPNGVTSIGYAAFSSCTSLTHVTIPDSVAYMEDQAFSGCTNLAGVFFQGNAPSIGPGGGSSVFSSDNNATAFYLPGTTGWGSTFGGIPTALWILPYPVTLNSSLGVQFNQFGFTVSWATNLSVVVEAATDLDNPVWSALATNTLSGGTLYFNDPQWTNYPSRFYRVRSQ
jgi:hypothetical protein